MGRLENISLEDLQKCLDEVEGNSETLRLVVGINYKMGVPQSELAEWYDVSRTTVHNWLTRLERLESDPLDEVIHDEPRSGRPSKLTDSERERLHSILRDPPSETGIEASAWSPPLVRAYVADEFGVDYTLRHIRTLMGDAGIARYAARSDRQVGGERASVAFEQGIEKTE